MVPFFHVHVYGDINTGCPCDLLIFRPKGFMDILITYHPDYYPNINQKMIHYFSCLHLFQIKATPYSLFCVDPERCFGKNDAAKKIAEQCCKYLI